jgi:hypothetical protein
LLYEQGFTISGARNKLDNRMANGEDIAVSLRSPDVDAIAIRNELSEILKLLER